MARRLHGTRASLRAACLLTVLGALGACARPAADNVLFISLDTTRADRLSAYGYRSPTSPAIDALAARGALFTRAYTHVPSTLPAHATMFSGRLPPEHGVRCNGKYRVSAATLTVAEILSKRGFETGAVVAGFPLESRFGLDQGFATYDDDFASSAVTAARRKGKMDDPGFWVGHDFVDFERGADEVTDRALAWLQQRKQRWFLFVHYFDPHWPYESFPGWEMTHDSPYDAEIAYADRHLGRLLDAVDEMPGRTLVIFTADHGEGLGEHGEALHNRFLYDSTLRVPLIVALRGVIRSKLRVDDLVGHVDLLPTILEFLRIPLPDGLSGASLVPSLTGRAPAESRPLYAETLVHTLERPAGVEVRALIDGAYKIIRTDDAGGRTRLELYDLLADPNEISDLSRSQETRTSQMAERLRLQSRELERHARTADAFELDEGTELRLRSLGYL